MEHIAIMRKSWRLTEKILTGQKKIESRWYSVKYQPWGRINTGDVVYFKDSGSPIRIKTEVEKVIQFDNLNPDKVREILQRYGADDGIKQDRIDEFFYRFKDKKYCLLIFLKNPTPVEPFEIDKTGFGTMSAWVTVNAVNAIKKI